MNAKPNTQRDPAAGADGLVCPKRRRLRFIDPGEEALRGACGKLLRLGGVVAAVPGTDCITVDYDLRQASLARVEAAVAGVGLVFRGGPHRWRRALWKFEESNEIESWAHPGLGACCNRPPAGLR